MKRNLLSTSLGRIKCAMLVISPLYRLERLQDLPRPALHPAHPEAGGADAGLEGPHAGLEIVVHDRIVVGRAEAQPLAGHLHAAADRPFVGLPPPAHPALPGP